MKNTFVSSVVKLASGTSLAHIVTIAVSPVLTRLFQAEEFGELQLFQSALIIGAIMATGTYELAIVRPKKDTDALALIKLSVGIAFVFSVFLMIPAVFTGNWIAQSMNIDPYLVLIFPVILFIQTLINTGNYWFLRKDRYSLLSFSKMSQSTGTASYQILHGFMGLPLNGLVSGIILGRVLVTLIFTINLGKKYLQSLIITSWSRVKSVASEYSGHPGYITFSTLLSTGGIEIPVLIIGSLFGQAELGFYALAYKVLSAPSAFVGTSVGHVFYRTAADRFAKKLPLMKFVLSTWGWLFLIVLPPMIVLVFYAEPIFAFVYGPEWVTSGTVATILVPLLMIDFISAPTGKLLIILNKQKEMSLFSFFISASRVGGILFGVVKADFLAGITLLVLLHSAVLVLYNIYLLYSARAYEKELPSRDI